MTTAQAPPPAALPSFDKIKMDERKRSLAAVEADDLAPRPKRVVKDENGQAMRMDAEKERDVENFQKDAIMRQMKDYKRQRNSLDEQLSEARAKARFHDDHLRILDAWFSQVLDELRVLARRLLPTPLHSAASTAGEELYGSALLFETSELFSEHLSGRAQNIKNTIAELFGSLPASTPETEELRIQLNDTMAKQKEQTIELRRALDEQESLGSKWQAAVERYMTAEKKLDRAKSQQVLKLERQAIMGSNGESASPTAVKKAGTPVKSDLAEVNGELTNGISHQEAEAARQEALAVAERQRRQTVDIEADNDRLTNALSASRTKLASLTDDDYAETALFKTLRSKHDDAVKRVNDLEVTNVQLREEAQKLQTERTAYRRHLDDESRESISESEAQIARAETDLARIRNNRDELAAELEIRKRAEDTRRTSADQARQLAEARDHKITAMQSEVERLQLKLGEIAPSDVDESMEDLDHGTLKTKLRTVEGQFSMLSNELSSMEAAWRKSSAIASQKIADTTTQEELISRLQAEKAKADQKYFAAMKAKDMKEGELRSLRAQNNRSSEIVTQLKDTDGKTRELVSNLERQLSESKEALSKLDTQHRTLDQQIKEAHLESERLRKQGDELRVLTASKEKEALADAKAKREAEVELEKCQIRLEELRRQVEGLKRGRAAENSASSDDWRVSLSISHTHTHPRRSN
ncbi:E3 ubiquitin-protein ligase bre1 [Recurvomyces mirabilis]|uniref:E3 ubiquitin protein ligase n=1 Tax=Recurvomyces mirabilis TaxID=574656 RepID=A0AAE0WKT7_9PEZI|nr:E3 ubiquitin-protein ligase bre1 [Recurvomyces mirabilis]KAK5151115.1 E3 ubiquitin-protein ligase bre1 [Recurvomyces mirabilis]